MNPKSSNTSTLPVNYTSRISWESNNFSGSKEPVHGYSFNVINSIGYFITPLYSCESHDLHVSLMAGQRQVAWCLASPLLAWVCHCQTSWEVYCGCRSRRQQNAWHNWQAKMLLEEDGSTLAIHQVSGQWQGRKLGSFQGHLGCSAQH